MLLEFQLTFISIVCFIYCSIMYSIVLIFVTIISCSESSMNDCEDAFQSNWNSSITFPIKKLLNNLQCTVQLAENVEYKCLNSDIITLMYRTNNAKSKQTEMPVMTINCYARYRVHLDFSGFDSTNSYVNQSTDIPYHFTESGSLQWRLVGYQYTLEINKLPSRQESYRFFINEMIKDDSIETQVQTDKKTLVVVPLSHYTKVEKFETRENKLNIIFSKEDSVICQSTSDRAVWRITNIEMTNPKDADYYKQHCFNQDPRNGDCRKFTNITDSECDKDSKNTTEPLTSCELYDLYSSGILICDSDDEKILVEYFTGLNGYKYIYSENDTLGMPYWFIVDADFEPAFESKLFYNSQWVTLSQRSIAYKPKSDVRWEYRLKNGRFGVFSEQYDNFKDHGNKVELEMSREIVEIYFVVPWITKKYTPGMSSYRVIVTDKSPPKMLSENSTIILEKGRKARLFCKAFGNPLPVLKWSKDFENLPQDSENRTDEVVHFYDTSSQISSSVLYVSGTDKEIDGVYACSAYSNGEEASTNWIIFFVDTNGGLGFVETTGLLLFLVGLISSLAVVHQIVRPPSTTDST